MKIESMPVFARLILGAVLGIISGIALGLVFSLIIASISNLFANGNSEAIPPYSLATFLGMGAGAIIGGISGAITYTKSK